MYLGEGGAIEFQVLGWVLSAGFLLVLSTPSLIPGHELHWFSLQLYTCSEYQ